MSQARKGRLRNKTPYDELLVVPSKFPGSNYVYADFVKKYNDKVASITLREAFRNRANQANYVNEYNRLKGYISSNVVGPYTVEQLRTRQQDLKKLIKHLDE